LQLAGKSESTQAAYTRSVTQLFHHYDKEPDLLSEEEIGRRGRVLT